MPSVLCVASDTDTRTTIELACRSGGHRSVPATDWDSAREALASETFDVLVLSCDAVAPASRDALLEEAGWPACVWVSGQAGDEPESLPEIARALPVRASIENALRAALAATQKQQQARLASEAHEAALAGVIGQSLPFLRVLDTVRKVAPTRSTILLMGPTGTGKEVFARAIHELSPRRGRPFVAVNCAALPEGLIESVMFGHEKGSFTGATEKTLGAFERASGGTILLDEISEMDFRLQAKLLRVVQEMQFERVGGQASVKVDVRIIATSNKDLARAVDQGEFREDLYYRLSVLPIQVPPLSERREDIPLLATHFIREKADLLGKQVSGLAPQALELLLAHSWPGNVRELAHAIEQAVALADGPLLLPQDFLPEKRGIAPWRRPAAGKDAAAPAACLPSLRLDEAEQVLIELALQTAANNRTRAAGLLGISVRTLRNKLNGRTS